VTGFSGVILTLCNVPNKESIKKDLNRTFVYMPKHISPRISAQAGGFTVHLFLLDKDTGQPIPFEREMDLQLPIVRPFMPDMCFGSLAQATIPAACKKYIRNQLHRLSIHRAALFPGLDGISDYIKQMIVRELE
jgi:hypothetical protein